MKFLVVALALLGALRADAGVLGGFATEWTQLANKLQLLQSYIRQGEQLKKAIEMVIDMHKNSQPVSMQEYGRIAVEIAELAKAVKGGQALAYSMANLDSEFRTRFQGWGYNSRRWYLDYRKWSQTTLDTIFATLRAAGLQGRQLENEQVLLDRLRAMARSSEGRMQALQVANQIAEQQVQQIMKLRQLMLADLQSKEVFQAAQIQRQASEEAPSEQFFTFGGRSGDGRGYQAAQ